MIDRKISAGVVIAAICGLMVLERFLTPYLAQIRPAHTRETLSYPLKSAYGRPDSE